MMPPALHLNGASPMSPNSSTKAGFHNIPLLIHGSCQILPPPVGKNRPPPPMGDIMQRPKLFAIAFAEAKTGITAF